jgi:hypothetical protein
MTGLPHDGVRQFVFITISILRTHAAQKSDDGIGLLSANERLNSRYLFHDDRERLLRAQSGVEASV